MQTNLKGAVMFSLLKQYHGGQNHYCIQRSRDNYCDDALDKCMIDIDTDNELVRKHNEPIEMLPCLPQF